MFDEIQNHLDPCDGRSIKIPTNVRGGVRRYVWHASARKVSGRRDHGGPSVASMPTVSRMVELDGHRYLDAELPIQFLLRLVPDGSRRCG